MIERETGGWEPAAVQFRLATIWQAKGQVGRAMAGYEAVIRLRPDYVPAHLALGQLALRHSTVEEAIAVYRRAHELNPREIRFQQQLAELTARREMQEETVYETGAIAPAEDVRRDRWPHLVLYTDCSGISGAEQWNHDILLRLAEAGYRLTCVQGRAAHHLIEERERLGIRHHWLDDDDLYHRTRPARALTDEDEPRRLLATTRPDLIVFSSGAPLSSLMAKQVARRGAIPYVIVVHCVTESWAARFAPYLPQLPEVYRQAEAVITVSQAGLRLLRARFGLPEDQGQVIYPGRPARFFAPPDPETRPRIRRELGIPAESMLVCTVASMEPRKGYQYLLRAIGELRASALWPRLHFAWVGTGSIEPRLRAAIEHLGVREQVRFLGQREDVADLLAAADIFALPSQYEGMPASIMEAMARGVPVVATAVSGIPEEMGETGRLLPDPLAYPDAAVRELTATIHSWARDAGLRRAVGDAGRRRAEALFTEDRMAADYLRIVEQVLRRAGHHRPGHSVAIAGERP